MTQRPRSEDTRAAILEAAVAEFAERGETGARTESISRAAGVNKALIHYHFSTKEALYQEVLDLILAGMKDRYLAILEGPGTAGERMMRYVLSSFDHMASAGSYARILGHEMMRVRSGESSSISRMAQTYFSPLHAVVFRTLEEGMGTGEFRAFDPAQTALSISGANVFYFIAAPVYREITGRDVREPDLLARRRAALLDLVACLLFSDRDAGQALARRLMAQPPQVTPIHPES